MKKLLLCVLLLSLVMSLSGCYSCRSYHKFWGNEVPDGAAEKLIWDSECRPTPKAEPEKPAEKPVAKENDCGPYVVTTYFPCKEDAVVRVDKEMPREVQVGKVFNYTITVTNLTKCMMADMTITEKMSQDFQYKSSSPQAASRGSNLVWSVDSIDGGEVVILQVTGVAADVKCLQNCTTVTYSFALCANVSVVKPNLALSKTAPESVLLCDTIPYKFVVTNTGSGVAENVKITDTLPAGLETVDGAKKIVVDVGDLTAGQAKAFTTNVIAEKIGKYVNKAYATSTNGASAQSEAVTTAVRKPVLTITKTGTQKQYIGREVSYEISVTNTGDADAENTEVVDILPDGIKSIKVSAGATVANGRITWEVGTLPVNTTKKFTVIFTPVKAANFVNVAEATAICADGVTAKAITKVTGIAAILLEVIDVSDPVELGKNETYIITATNQGSAPDTNVTITCELEENQIYVSSSGATVAVTEGNLIKFAPLKTLPPKNKATWTVVVKSVKAGDVRFKVSMDTDETSRPVQETEATRLYE